MPQQSILDARLAEIDRRLRTIQSGLAPPAQEGVGSAPDPGEPDSAPAVPGGAPPGVLAGELAQLAELISQLRQLTDAHERLLATSRQLLSGPGSGPRAGPGDSDGAGRLRRHDDAPAGAPLRLAAGPFPDTIALRRFERALAGLPEVRAVTVREYAGEDGVVVDVHLSAPTS